MLNLRTRQQEIGRLFAIATILFIILSGINCFGRQRVNWNWQLDSLRYYTAKFDSTLIAQGNELSQLRVDLYTKTNELSEKIEMLNSRIGDTESQLTQISAKLGSQKKVAADSGDISQISPEARMIYESAYLNYTKGNYQDAIKGFQSFSKLQPNSPLSDNALYWIGESFAAMGKRQDAVNTFQDLMNKYPESSRIPTALYKMGIIYEEAGDKKTARSYFNQLTKKYPNAPEAGLAKNKLK